MHTLEQLRNGSLQGTKELRLSCGLTEFPREIFSLSDSLEVLDLSGNRLSRLPDDFGRLAKLRIIFFSDNLFTEVPPVIYQCRKLSMIGFKSNRIRHISEGTLPESTRWLILTNNELEKLPDSIGNCLPLQKVALAGNKLKALPASMMNCRNLELLRISANRFSALPEWLPGLPKLSWLAFSGNPFSHTGIGEERLAEVSWREVELLEQLGEGASGNIYRALWHKPAGGIQQVAVKLFKGEVTSDGYPGDELRASIAAGIQQHLVPLLGEIKEHPSNKKGLVMELIPASFYNLGLPPSLETCSRDTFKAGTVFTGAQILKIGKAVASATVHLHRRGIMHGDLYAHNILTDAASHVLLGDFGAASFYETESAGAQGLQRIEARAFGCLLDDLLQHLNSADRDTPAVRELMSLRTELMQEAPEKRPLLEELQSRLALL